MSKNLARQDILKLPEILDITEAQRKPQIQPDRMLNDLGGKAVTCVGDRHRRSLTSEGNARHVNATTPSPLLM